MFPVRSVEESVRIVDALYVVFVRLDSKVGGTTYCTPPGWRAVLLTVLEMTTVEQVSRLHQWGFDDERMRY